MIAIVAIVAVVLFGVAWLFVDRLHIKRALNSLRTCGLLWSREKSDTVHMYRIGESSKAFYKIEFRGPRSCRLSYVNKPEGIDRSLGNFSLPGTIAHIRKQITAQQENAYSHRQGR